MASQGGTEGLTQDTVALPGRKCGGSEHVVAPTHPTVVEEVRREERRRLDG